MKKTLSLFTRLFFLCIFTLGLHTMANAQGLNTPRESPPTVLKQTIGLTDIEVHYSRPQVKRHGQDRTGKIWGGPAWYGFMDVGNSKIPWRAGANENTVISFSDDVKIEGKPLKAGKYGLQMALEESGDVTVIFSKNSSLWGSFGYNPEEDALRVNVKAKEASFVNALTYDFTDLGANYGVLALSWEKKQIPFKIEIELKETVLVNLRNQLKEGGNAHWQGLNDAASYCAQNNFNHDEAIEWAEQSIKKDKNIQNLSTQAILLYQKGDQEASLATTDKIAHMADVNELNNLGYQMMNLKLNDKAVEYFQLNVDRNPENANCYDSLGEALMATGENKKAIKSFKKSLSLNPAQNVKDNSIANLKKLGVEWSGS